MLCGYMRSVTLLTAGMQTAAHAVSCLEAHLHGDIAATKWSTLEDAEAADPKDVLELMRMHANFASTCASKALLATDAHLCSVVSNLLEACLCTSKATDDRLLPGIIPPQGVPWSRGEACMRLQARLTDPAVWGRLEGVLKDLRQRVPYLKARLEYRAGLGTFEEWYTMMAF